MVVLVKAKARGSIFLRRLHHRQFIHCSIFMFSTESKKPCPQDAIEGNATWYSTTKIFDTQPKSWLSRKHGKEQPHGTLDLLVASHRVSLNVSLREGGGTVVDEICTLFRVSNTCLLLCPN